MPRVPSVPAVVIWPGLPLLYVLLPGHPHAALSGLPLSSLALGFGLLVVLATWCGPIGGRPRRWLVAGLLAVVVLKLALAGLGLPYGLTARYSASGDPTGPAEASTEWRLAGATRVDASPELIGDRFPVYFFNDLERFNFYTRGQPRRDRLPFGATWQGWVVWPEAAERCLRLEANGSARLRLGELPPLSIERAAGVERREGCGQLGGAPAALELRFSRPEGGAPFLRLSEIGPDGSARALDSTSLLRQPIEPAALERDQLLGRLAQGLDLLLVALCGGLVWDQVRRSGWRALRRERLLLALLLLLAFVEALAVNGQLVGRAAILSGGNDWLAYESYAREILLTGPLLTGGKPLGAGEPYYYQPLYAYFLAGLHLLLGEPLYGLLVAQYLLTALAGLVTYFLARELYGRPTAVVALGLFWLLRYLIFNQVAGLLLSENLVALLVPLLLLTLARWQATWRRRYLVTSGALLGLAILTRSTPLLFLPPALGLVVWAQRGKFGQWWPALGAAGLLLVVTLAVAGLMGARNYVVSGRPVLLPESATTNLWETHRPSARVDLSGIGHDPLYERLNLDQRTREVLEFIRQDPLGYIGTLVPMGLYPIGVTGPALGTSQLQYELIGLTLLYLVGALGPLLLRRRLVADQPPRSPFSAVLFLHAFVLTHFLQLMVFFSHQYGFRLPMPMYGPMTVVAGAALTAGAGAVWCGLGRGLARPVRWSDLAVGAALLAALSWSGREVMRPRSVEASVFGLGGQAGPVARAVSESPAARSAERVYFGGRDGRSLGVAYLPGLRYREMKWLDLEQALVWSSPTRRGLLARPAGLAAPLLAACLEPAGPPVWAADEPILFYPLPASEQRRCGQGERRLASFGGFVELLAARPVQSGPSGPASLEVAWRVLQAPSFEVQVVVERLDQDGAVLASNPYEPYPSGSWENGEVVVARLPVPGADRPTSAEPRLAVGFSRGEPTRRLTIDDPLPLYRQVRVRISE